MYCCYGDEGEIDENDYDGIRYNKLRLTIDIYKYPISKVDKEWMKEYEEKEKKKEYSMCIRKKLVEILKKLRISVCKYNTDIANFSTQEEKFNLCIIMKQRLKITIKKCNKIITKIDDDINAFILVIGDDYTEETPSKYSCRLINLGLNTQGCKFEVESLICDS